MGKNVKVLDDYEDCDAEWESNPKGHHDIPKSTMTGKIILREVRQGRIVEVNLDDGDHEATEKYLEAMADNYSLVIMKSKHRWVIGPEPNVSVTAIPTEIDEEAVA